MINNLKILFIFNFLLTPSLQCTNNNKNNENPPNIAEIHTNFLEYQKLNQQIPKIIENSENIPENSSNSTSLIRTKRRQIFFQIQRNSRENFADSSDYLIESKALECSDDYASNIIDYYKHIQTTNLHVFKITNETSRKGTALACSQLIKSGYFDTAEKIMDGIDDIELIIEIIRDSFTGENEINVTKFINRIDSDEEKSAAYSILYEQIKKFNKLSSVAVIEILFQLNWMLMHKKIDIMTLESELKIVNYAIDENSIVNDAIKTLASKDADNIVAFIDSFRGSFDSIVPKFVKTYYNGDLGNFDKVISLINRYYAWKSTQNKMLNAMLDEMKKFNHFNTQEMLHFVKNVKEKFPSNTEVIAKLPPTLKQLFFNDVIKIVSKSNEDYTVYMSSAGNVYAYPDENYEGGKNQKFKIEIDSNFYFQFECVENTNVIISDGVHIYGTTKRNSDSQWWKLNPKNDGNFVYFENKNDDRVMNFGKLESCYSSTSGSCSTVKGNDYFNDDDEQLWAIECAECYG